MVAQMENKFYVYELAYPESMGGDVFYVGKGRKYKIGKGFVDRIDVHEKEASLPLKSIKKWSRNVEKCLAIRSICFR